MGGKIYYWDSCCFLALIKNELREPGQMNGLIQVQEQFDRNECTIMSSVILRMEVLKGKWDDKHTEIFNGMLKRRNMQEIEINSEITQFATEIREFSFNQSSESKKPKLSVPDVLHLATAIILEANEFHTFDGCGNNKGIIDYNHNVAGHDLLIKMPFLDQQSLDFDEKTNNHAKQGTLDDE